MASTEIGGREARAASRSNVFLAATLYSGARSFAVRIRNISGHGAMLEGLDLPGEHDKVVLQRGGLSAPAQVAWRRDSFEGLWFDKPVDPALWVRPVGHSGQRRVDMVVAAYRQGAPAAANPAGSIPLPVALASLGAELEQICERLTAVTGLSVHIAEELLKIDGVAQSLLKLSRSEAGAGNTLLAGTHSERP